MVSRNLVICDQEERYAAALAGFFMKNQELALGVQVCSSIAQALKIQEAAPAEGLVGEIPTLSYPGVRVKNVGLGDNLYGALQIEKEKTQLTAIPYCLWNNRGEGEMLVWHRVLI